MPGRSTTGEVVESAEREQQAMRLRIRGHPYRVIAAELGISIPGAFKIVKRVIERNRKEANELSDDVRDLELERLDNLLAIATRKAEDDEDLQAMDRVLRIAERRARLLGLDMPEKHDVQMGLTIEGLDAILETARAAKGEG
jgi:hypothetical protein